MKRLLPPSLLPLSLLTPTAALAHPGDHGSSNILHLLTEPDHLALLAVIVAAVAFAIIKLRARR